MLQKQFFRPQFQTSSQQLQYNQSRLNITPSFSPKVEYASITKKTFNSPRYTQSKQNIQHKPKTYHNPYYQASQSYESYDQKINITNSIQVGQSQHSRCSRTQKSKNHMKALQQIKEEQQNIQKLKKKYTTLMKEEQNKTSSIHGQKYDIPRGNKFVSGTNPSHNSESYDKKMTKLNQKPNRHLKTQTSRQRNLYTQKSHKNKQNTPQHPIQSSQNLTHTRSINNSFNPRHYNNEQSQTSQHMMSPSQEYYSGSYQNQSSENQQQLRDQLQVINRRYAPLQSRDASTVNTQHQRASSLSFNKFAKKSMLTFYHCQAKKFYQYNDEGYLTDREIALRDKVQKAAGKAIDRLIIEQQQDETEQTNILKKSLSLDNFPKLIRLKQQAEKQRKVRFQLDGKYQISKQTDSYPPRTNEVSKEKSYIPSELPPSSSLSKKRFNVIYKDQNQNILQKNLIDDSYHQRQEKEKLSHVQQFTENARSSIIKKNKQKKSKLSHISSQKHEESLIEYQMLESNKKLQINDQSPKGISKIGGVASDYMISSKKNISSVIDQSKTSKSKFNRSKPSFVEQFSESSISDVKSSSKNSVKQKPESSKQSERQSGKSIHSQNLDMINSNYKKLTLTDQQLKINASENSSLKLKTNTDKDKKNRPVETQQIKMNPKSESMSQQSNFESSVESVNKQSSNSVKSSHIGLKKESLKRKKSKGSKLSSYGSESGIDGKLRKKQSGHKWIRESEVNESQHLSRADVNMRKKEKVHVGESLMRLKEGHEEMDKNVRLSVESNGLKLDSLVNLPNKTIKRQSQARSKIDEQNQSNRSESKQQQLQETPKRSQNEQSPYKLHSQCQLLQESIQNIKESMKLSKHQKSRLSSQRESERSKMQKSKMSNGNNRLSGNKDEKDMKILVQKYGNYLKVDDHRQVTHSDVQSQSRGKSLNSQSYNHISSGNQSQTSQYHSHNTQQFTQSHQNSFNLTQRAQELLQIEQNLHQKRRNLENHQNMTQDFQEVLAKIQAHISIIKELLYIATNAIEIYSEDSPWVFKSCLLSLKKYHLERVKIASSLKGKKSCFNIAQNQLAEEDLKQFLSHPEITLLANDFQYCNQLNLKLIEDFVSYLREYFGENFSESQFNLRPFDDRFDLGALLQEYRTEILGLREKAAPNSSLEKGEEDEEALEEQTQDTIKTRIFKLMQASFLLSELTGKRIKQFIEEIEIQDDFDQYFSDYWPYFERIVKTFS